MVWPVSLRGWLLRQTSSTSLRGSVARIALPTPVQYSGLRRPTRLDIRHGSALGLINVYDVLGIPDHQVHRLAGALGQPLQMQLGHPHDVHAVHDAGGQLEHLQRQAVMAGDAVLPGIAQLHQAGQQPVGGAFGKAGFRRQLLQPHPRRVGGQHLDDAENALDALHAARFAPGLLCVHGVPSPPRRTVRAPKINKKFTFSPARPGGRQFRITEPVYQQTGVFSSRYPAQRNIGKQPGNFPVSLCKITRLTQPRALCYNRFNRKRNGVPLDGMVNQSW